MGNDYVTASVTSNNGCDQSNLVANEYHIPCSGQSLYSDDCGWCKVELWDDASQSTATSSDVSLKGHFDYFCTQYTDLFMVLTIEDTAG